MDYEMVARKLAAYMRVGDRDLAVVVLVAALRQAESDTREECARVADDLDSPDACPMCPRDVAAAIRARSGGDR